MEELFRLFFQLLSALKDVAPEALVKAVFVLVAVFALRWLEVIPSSNWSRTANIVFSVLLSGILSGASTPQEVELLALTSAFASALYHAIDLLWKFIKSKTGLKPPSTVSELKGEAPKESKSK